MGRKRDMQIADMVGKPIGEKMDQLEVAVRKDGEQTRREYKQQIGEIKKVVDVVLEDLSSREKKELYDLNTLIDISTLEETEKRFLVEALYTLAGMNERMTETQQAFIRSVQKYLGIKNIQTMVDLASIENIEDIPTQKALLQTIMEFLFLEKNDHSYISEYEDVLSYFSVNKKSVQGIQNAIGNIYTAVGEQGLSEKYGYVAEVEASPSDTMKEEISLNGKLIIEAGSTKVFSNVRINLDSAIECKGILRFENCDIYSDSSFKSEIINAEKAEIIFNNCSITFEEKNGECMINSDNSQISFSHCTLHKCKGLIKGYIEGCGSICFDSCQSDDLCPQIIQTFDLDKLQIIDSNFSVGRHLSNVKGTPDFGNGKAAFQVHTENFKVSGSTFCGFTDGVFSVGSESGNAIIKKSKFISCAYIFSGTIDTHIEQSEFEQCIHLFSILDYNQLKLSDCQFQECIGKIDVDELSMEGCTFKNGIPYIDVPAYVGGSGSCTISNCIFEDWDLQQMCSKLMHDSLKPDSYFKFTTDNEVLSLLTEHTSTLIKLGNNGELKACKFSDIDITPLRFLIECPSGRSASLSYCTAQNCNADESLLDRNIYTHYGSGLFSKGKKQQATYYLGNCKGFDY